VAPLFVPLAHDPRVRRLEDKGPMVYRTLAYAVDPYLGRGG